jgi:hypothetical protein
MTKENNLPIKEAVLIDSIVNELISEAVKIYRRDIMKDKHGIDLDLNKFSEYDSNAGDSYKQKFSPCEVCAQTRTIHQCHIIPRSSGGANKRDNYVVLCANHHDLFDKYRLTRSEWEKIDWSLKSEEAREYVRLVRLPRQEMHWKYGTGGIYAIEGCACGITDFDISYNQYNGESEWSPSGLERVLTCKSCGNDYTDAFFNGYEFEWWWNFILEKARKGELLLPKDLG